jgi:hypothetical protein
VRDIYEKSQYLHTAYNVWRYRRYLTNREVQGNQSLVNLHDAMNLNTGLILGSHTSTNFLDLTAQHEKIPLRHFTLRA